MFDHPYAPFLINLERPGRYLGGEFGSAPNKANPDVRIALAFPDAYEIGMSHIGLSVLYEIVNSSPNMSAERVFMPWPDLEKELVERDLPLVSLETATPLGEFDVLGFSLQYELCYTNFVAMLSLAKVPRRAEDRKQGDPLIIVGGPVASHCEPIAPFVDLVFVGDGEEELPRFLDIIAKEKKKGTGRAELIERLSEIPSVFAPFAQKRIKDPVSNRMVVETNDKPVAVRAAVSDLGDQPTGLGPVPTIKSVFDRYSFEVARGCTAGCRFCQAGFLYRPVRERNEDHAASAVERATGCLGLDDVSLAALSTADHSRIGPIVSMLGQRFTKRGVSFSVPSLRAYGLDEKLVDVLASLRATNVTLAPEAGSQRMRDVVNKNVTEGDLMEAAARFFGRGITRIKLYFMLGLPGETEQDLVEIIELSDRLRNLGTRILSGRKPNVTVSVSTFVPKPFTPFEREAMVGYDEIRSKQELIRKLGRRKKLEVRVHGPDLSILEGIFCRGDVSLAPVLERAVDSGARFDSWGELYNAKVWNEILGDMDIPAKLNEIPTDARTPWDHIDVGVKPEFFKKEKDKATQAETTPPCGRYFRDNEKDEVICHACGIGCPPDSLATRVKREPNDGSEKISYEPVTKLRPRPAPSAEGENPIRTRLFYAKWGRQSYIGHLDTMRHIMYSLRRAGLILAYTKGFHPKPKVESAPALPLGTSGLMEPIDVFLIDPPEPKKILEILADTVPADLAFTGVDVIGPGVKSLSKQINSFEYVAFVKASKQDALAGVKRVIESRQISIERERKGKIRQLDIRPFILNAEVLEVDPAEVRLPMDEERVSIKFALEVPGSGGARPREVLSSIFGETSDSWIVRTRVFLKKP